MTYRSVHDEPLYWGACGSEKNVIADTTQRSQGASLQALGDRSVWRRSEELHSYHVTCWQRTFVTRRNFLAFAITKNNIRPVSPLLGGCAFRTVARLHSIASALRCLCVLLWNCQKRSLVLFVRWLHQESKTTTETQTTPFPRGKQLRTHWMVVSIQCCWVLFPAAGESVSWQVTWEVPVRQYIFNTTASFSGICASKLMNLSTCHLISRCTYCFVVVLYWLTFQDPKALLGVLFISRA